MTCFEVTINKKLVCTAGVNDVGMLLALVELAKRKPQSKGQRNRDYIKLRVGGSEANDGRIEQLDWLNRRIKVGDEIKIRVVEASRSDKPKSRESLK
ncbi:MAG TPA: hypothetical protein VKB86_09715 [Pyrinomonadaceae bacterium]|nr:hypothetical protein [Pyrinomonadaceae bacterium]